MGKDQKSRSIFRTTGWRDPRIWALERYLAPKQIQAILETERCVVSLSKPEIILVLEYNDFGAYPEHGFPYLRTGVRPYDGTSRSCSYAAIYWDSEFTLTIVTSRGCSKTHRLDAVFALLCCFNSHRYVGKCFLL